MPKIKVAVVGYGVIGSRLADAVVAQGDMELAGIIDVAPTLTIRAMFDSKEIYRYMYLMTARRCIQSEGMHVEGKIFDILPK